MPAHFAIVAALKDDRVFSAFTAPPNEASSSAPLQPTTTQHHAANYEPIARKLLAKIRQQPSTSRMSYLFENYLFHYIIDNDIVFMCVTDEATPRKSAFTFLEDAKKAFKKMYGDNVGSLTAATTKDFVEVLRSKIMEPHDGSGLRIKQIQAELGKVKDIMADNIDKVLARGERFEDLATRTEELDAQALSFLHGTQRVRRQMWWRNVRIMILAGVSILVVALVLFLSICGFTLKCLRKH